jgi:arsenite methyltransferase
MLAATLARELFTAERFDRLPESEGSMESEEAVTAFARAGQPSGVLSGFYAFYTEQACKMIRAGDSVLDLGCGPGRLLSSIAALRPEARFVGADCSALMIACGRKLPREAGTGNVDLRMEDMTELATVESGSVNVVLSSMAMHHLPDTDHLQRCFAAIERVLADDGRVFVVDFGRIRSLKSVEYFVRRAIPPNEPQLAHDYRASLRAAFSKEEFSQALPDRLKQRVCLYSTVISPLMMVMMTPFPKTRAEGNGTRNGVVRTLPGNQRADYRQLRVSLRLGGMPWR